MARAYTNLWVVSVTLRRFDAASRYLRAGLAYCTDHDADLWRSYLTGFLALCEFWQGDYDAALGRAEALLREPSPAVARVWPLLVLGRIRARRGQPGASAPLAGAWALAVSTGELQRMGPVAAARAEAAWLAGDAAGTVLAARDMFDLALEREDAWMVGELGFWLWRAGALPDPPDVAAHPYALQMRGQPRAAAAAWRKIGAPYEVAMAECDLADDRALREAHRAFDRLGADVSSLLGKLGARSRVQAAARAGERLGTAAAR